MLRQGSSSTSSGSTGRRRRRRACCLPRRNWRSGRRQRRCAPFRGAPDPLVLHNVAGQPGAGVEAVGDVGHLQHAGILEVPQVLLVDSSLFAAIHPLDHTVLHGQADGGSGSVTKGRGHRAVKDDGTWCVLPYIGAAGDWIGGSRENVRRCCQSNRERHVNKKTGKVNTDHKYLGVRFYYESDNIWTTKVKL